MKVVALQERIVTASREWSMYLANTVGARLRLAAHSRRFFEVGGKQGCN